MYVPTHFRESHDEVLETLVRHHALGILVSILEGTLNAEHLPMQLLRTEDGQRRLRGHVARANPLWRRLPNGSAVLAVFQGAQHYISPSWYPSKAEHGRVVPTWNYSAVHVSGSIQFLDSPAWLQTLVESLTDEHEQRREQRWRVSDAPADHIASLLDGIVGFEIQVSSILGKFKSSQNRPAADRQAVREALRAEGIPDTDLHELVREPGGG